VARQITVHSSGLLGNVKWLKTDVSGLHILPIFTGKAVKEEGPLNMELLCSPETSSSNRLTLLNSPVEGIIYKYRDH
jgi:hypothetical protein